MCDTVLSNSWYLAVFTPDKMQENASVCPDSDRWENHQFHIAAKPSLNRLRSIGHVSFQSYAVVIVFPI